MALLGATYSGEVRHELSERLSSSNALEFGFLRYLRTTELRPIARGEYPIPAEAEPVWREVVSRRLEGLVDGATPFEVLRALLAQGESPSGVRDLFRWLRFAAFITWGVLVYGKVGFCELLFEGSGDQERASFAGELLRSSR